MVLARVGILVNQKYAVPNYIYGDRRQKRKERKKAGKTVYLTSGLDELGAGAGLNPR